MNENTVMQAIYAHWLETGEAATRADIAERLGVKSTTRVSKIINDACGSVPGSLYGPKYKSQMSKNYPSMGTGRPVKVDAWIPSHEYIRAQIRGGV